MPALAALAHERRLALFRALVVAGPDGLSAGAIAHALDVPPSSLSHHLGLLEQAGLTTVRRAGRSLIYAADFAAMRALIDFLLLDCCRGIEPEQIGACAKGECA
ncbi:ArsR/SmtB family transcription factor [Sandarakinorhabdus oryzae]|uniref:ArsR/SmtB family transcription factor n=1 Tax=Sandarakinorhabdus oryzae TaxID=2675220 RepID=UPI0038B561B3